ncbi:MAG: alpha/beta hydrolase [Dehalococcoidia bacterium]|nr:MAG: alpha/beta hydrolase [Dehalococcoidia bacterium]
MMNLHKYGNSPFKIALIHGGPGAPCEMAPVARELAETRGVLEPIQTALTIDGEVEELRQALMENGALPVILVGYSWGAWLSFMLAERYPSLVSKLILVSSGPFTQEYAFDTDRTRFERLNSGEREEMQTLKSELDNLAYKGDKDALMARVGELFGRVDSFDPLPHTSEAECRWDIFSAVWPQAAALRRSGALLALGKDIKCPVVAIHGDYDPHPEGGVRIPLSGVLKDFRFILLEKCGHVPWFERQARDRFYAILEQELSLMGEPRPG